MNAGAHFHYCSISMNKAIKSKQGILTLIASILYAFDSARSYSRITYSNLTGNSIITLSEMESRFASYPKLLALLENDRE